MRLAFWKPKPRRIQIPVEHAEEVLSLVEIYYSLPKGKDFVARFRVYRAIQRVVPETREGRWKLDTSKAIPWVEEIL